MVEREKSGECEAKLYHIPMTPRQLADLNTDIEMKRYPAGLNSCMGGVAELLNRHSNVYFPPVVRQLPSLSATYIDGMKAISSMPFGKVEGATTDAFKSQPKTLSYRSFYFIYADNSANFRHF